MENDQERAIEVLEKLRSVGITIDDLVFVLSKINDSQEKQKAYEQRIHAYLTRLGIPSNLRGREFITKMLLYMHENANKRMSMEEIYKAVTDKYGYKKQNVERCVRSAIEAMQKNGDAEFIDQTFRNNFSKQTGSIPNSKFIRLLHENLEMGKDL